MKKKIFTVIFLLTILIANLSFASYSTVTMSVVEEPICTIDLGSNSKFEKKLISKDLANKEVTLQLQVTNQEELQKPTGEIVLVLDNSNSMKEEVSTGKTRKDLIFEAAKNLISKFLEDNTKLKVSIVSFSTNVDQSKEATEADAALVSSLTNDASALTNAISGIDANGPRTNLESGLVLGAKQFSSEENNKYMVVLTDGVPNVALGSNNPYYSDDVITKTNTQLKAISNKGIHLITMLTGIKDENYVPAGITKNFGQIIKEVFGTTENPTAGKFYYVTDTEIENTIKEEIYNALIPVKKSLKDITVVDYFPEEIINNFDFAYVSQANMGTISAKVDPTTRSITWTIPELASGQTATVQYKLKLKQNFDSKIVNQILNTNEKVDLNYKDLDGKEQIKTSDVSPKLKLVEPPAILPKAGTTILISFVLLATGLLIFSIVKLTILRNKMN